MTGSQVYSEMTKTGKPDTYWKDVCFKYARGQFHFSTGKRPGAKKWKTALAKIEECPLKNSHTKDLIGGNLRCTCGFHASLGAGSSKSPGGDQMEAGRAQVSTELRSSPTAQSPTPAVLFLKTAPSLLYLSCSSAKPPQTAAPLESVTINWKSFLPEQCRKAIQEADQEWIAKCLYEPTGQLKQKIQASWFHPPLEPKPCPPEPGWYYRQRLFIWAPMRMWGIPLKCPWCSCEMSNSGIYGNVREVIDVDSRYYLVGGDYPYCNKCSLPVCPWSQDLLSQLDVVHRSKFPAVFTAHLALDRKCMTLLKPRTNGNSSYFQSAIEEAHSDEWARQTISYFSDCEHHKKMAAVLPSAVVYLPPPPFRPLPRTQWFDTVHSNEISHLDELKGVITSTYGRIFKIDSTKKEEDEEEDCATQVEVKAEEANCTILANAPNDQLSRCDTESEVLATETSQCDSRGVVGWEAVDALASYFVNLNRTMTALSTREEMDIVRLYTALHDMDKAPSRNTQNDRKKAQVSAGPRRAPRKPSGSAPGQQAAARLHMTHDQAAQDPEVDRVSECVCLRLAKEFEQARNRPKDTKGKTMPIPQSIVSIYSHLRQLLEDSKVVRNKTNLVLVPVNNTTVSSWLLRRDKRKDRDMLQQGTVPPKPLHLPKEPVPAVNAIPAAPVENADEVMTFEDHEEEAFPHQRTLAASVEPECSQPVFYPPQYGPPPQFEYPPFYHASPALHSQFAQYTPSTQAPPGQPPPPYQYPPCHHASPFPHSQFANYPPFTHAPPVQHPPPVQQALSCPGAPQACLPSQSRQRKWRLHKAALEDEELVSNGEPPKKRRSKENYTYTCKQCGQDKSKRTGHTQVKGRWYCPASGLTIDDWKKKLQ
ncbi:uncharacterized protein LOC130931029 isoform X2 [Corythoichthys intestinalis]|uniref:uncharacterized protein LOC130931029 isoform X2 n=1 Tax=Corythoichthys intestinalis TaxID=161448 RepID=UPI0025A6306B|nr:uncharacterized protein LOC130931029 isoform X2 [Corythoichthys intestinalis]